MSLGRPRNHSCRISDEWSLQGMRTLILENSQLRVVLLLDKGCDIIEFRYKPFDLDFLYMAPGGVRNPAQTQPSAASRNPFIDYYSGGWNEILPNGGPFVDYQGAELGQHAEFSLLRWEYAIVEDTPQSVAGRVWARGLRTPLFLEKTLSLEVDRPVLTIEETLTNEGGVTFPVMWGHHIALGGEFLRTGAIIDVPARQLIIHPAMPGYEPRRFQPDQTSSWPMTLAPDGKPVDASLIPAEGAMQAQEMAYLAELSDGWYAVTSPRLRVGFGVHFDHQLYRYIWYWQQLGDVAAEFPWWGRTHTTALEPWTSYPTNGLLEAIANGTALLLQPGEQVRTTFKALAYQGLERVTTVTPAGDVIG